MFFFFMLLTHWKLGLGLLFKSPFIIFYIRDFADFAKQRDRSCESHSYLTCVAAAKLQWHLSNMNVIIKRCNQ